MQIFSHSGIISMAISLNFTQMSLVLVLGNTMTLVLVSELAWEVLLDSMRWLGLVVTTLVISTKLLYVEPG